MNTKKIHLQSKCTIPVERKKERKKTKCKLFTKISQQQVNQMARTADQCQSCVNSWPFVYDDDGIIKYLLCACVWMSPARVTKQHPTTTVVGGRGLNFQKTINLFLWNLFFNWICKTKCKSTAIWDHRESQLQSVSWILAEFYFNRGLQRLYTVTCTILQKKQLTGFFVCLLFFLKVKRIS